MKKIAMLVLLLLLSCGVAFAASVDFKTAVEEKGMDGAVAELLAEGITVDAIMASALTVEGVNPQAVMVALLNNGADFGAVLSSAARNNVSPQVIAAVSRQHEAQGASSNTDTQAYTPASAPARVMAALPVGGVPGGGGGGGAPAEPYHASPSTF